jgi:hypothetical protein
MTERKADSGFKSSAKQQQYGYIPLTLSMETLGGIATPLIPRGTPLPVKRSKVFSTAVDNQESVEIKIFWGERPLSDKNILIGSFLLEDIPKAPKGTPQIRVTFEVDGSCNITVKAAEVRSGKEMESIFSRSAKTLTAASIAKAIQQAAISAGEDSALAVIAEAENVIREDQEQNSTTSGTTKIETLIAELGNALSEKDAAKVAIKTKQLKGELSFRQLDTSAFGFGALGGFSDWFQPTAKRQRHQNVTSSSVSSAPAEAKGVGESEPTVPTGALALIQSCLEAVDPVLEQKRSGAWVALESGRPDGCVQASHSMREVLRQLIDKLAPEEQVKKAPWYKEPNSGASVTRAMRIRYIVLGSGVASASSLSLTNDLAQAVESMYAKLSAESHSKSNVTITATRMYLNACEAVIGLIAIHKRS